MKRRSALILSFLVVASAIVGVSQVGAEPYTSTTMSLSGEKVFNPVVDEGDGAADGGNDIILAGDDATNTTISSEVTLDNTPPGTIDTVTLWINGTTGADYNYNVTVWGGNETADGVYGASETDTTELTSFVPSFSTGAITVSLPATATDETNYTLEFVTNASDSDGTADNIQIDVDTSTTATAVSSAGATSAAYGNVTVRSPPTTASVYEPNAEQFVWTEHVNETTQLTNRWSGLSVEIPFTRTSVVGVENVRYGVNGSALSTVSHTFYESNDTVVATLDSGDMSTVKPEITVASVGQKVTPIDGTVTIGPEQDEGQQLNQSFTPDTITGKFGLALNETAGDRVYDTNVTSTYRVDEGIIYPDVTAGTPVRAYWTNLTATVDTGYAEIDVTSDGGEWQNATIKNNTAPVSLNVTRDGWNPVTVDEDADAVNLTHIGIGDGEPDLRWVTENGSTVTVSVSNLEPGKEVLIVDSETGEAIDQAKVQNDTSVEFSGTNSTTVQLRYGLQLDYGAFTVDPIIKEYRFIQGAERTDNFTVQNNLADSYNLNVTTEEEWINIQNESFELGAVSEQTVEYNVTSTDLSPGTHHGEIIIEGSGTTGTVDVYLTVLPAPSSAGLFGLTSTETLFAGAVVVIIGAGLLYYYSRRSGEQATWSQ